MKIMVNDASVVIRCRKPFGAHLRHAANIPAHHLVLRETAGKQDDLIQDDTPIYNGDNFVTHPSTGFGG